MNILLCCSAGMSTSLLVTKMQASAESQGIDCKIWAIGNGEVRNHDRAIEEGGRRQDSCSSHKPYALWLMQWRGSIKASYFINKG